MKRVLFNFITSQPNQIDGISQYAFSLLNALVRRGEYEYILLTSWDKESLPLEVRALNLRIVQVRPVHSEKAAYFINAFRSWLTAKRMGADLVFTPHPFGPPFGGTKRVMVVHDLYRLMHPELYRPDRVATWRAFVRWSSARSHRVICVSNATRESFVDHYGDDVRAQVVHEASTLKSLIGKSAKRSSSDPYGLIVANVVPTKNIALLFQALDILQRRSVHPKTSWVGRDDSGDFAAAQRRFPHVRIDRLGSVSSDELSVLYRDARFFATTSLIEGFCIPVLEAQGFGTPVICTDIPTLREVAGDGALFFDSRDATALADCIEALWTNDEVWREMSNRARENAARFSWAKAAAETEAIFHDTLESARCF